jgi:hypothetical protein
MQPLAVVRSTSPGWRKPFTNHDLVILDGQIAAVRTTLRSELSEMKIDREVLGRAHGSSEVNARMGRHSDDRVSAALADTAAAGAADDTLIFSAADIADARLSKGLALCKLRVTLKDGRKLKWSWLPRYGSYAEVGRALRQSLGECVRLT